MKFEKPLYVTRPILPDINKFEEYLKDIWQSGVLSNKAKYHNELKNELLKYLNVDNLVLFNNGTIALITALQALRVTGKVITSPFSTVYDTPIIYKLKNEIKLDYIGEIVDKYCKEDDKNKDSKIFVKDLEVLSIDSNFICKWSKVAYVFRHKNTNKVYTLKTNYGYNVTCTENHSVAVFENEKIIYKKIQDIKINDYLISYHTIENNLIKESDNCLNLLDILKNTNLKIYTKDNNLYFFIEDNIKKFIKENYNIKTVRQFDENFRFYKNKNYISIKYFKFIKNCNMFDLSNSFIGFTQDTKISTKLILDSDFSYILGVFIAEGNLNRHGIQFSIHENETNLKTKIIEFSTKFNLKFYVKTFKKSKGISIIIYGNVLKELFKNICYNSLIEHTALTKKIPNIIFSLSNNLKKDFLKGYFDGDGCYSDNRISSATSSKKLSEDLVYLLNFINIKASVVIRPEKEACIHLSKKKSLQHKSYIISYKPNHTKFGYLNTFVPWKQITNKFIEIGQNQTYVDFNKLSVRNQSNVFKFINNLCFPLVKSIIEEDSKNYEYVYDLSVPETENFVGGVGGLLLHNTFAATTNALYWNNIEPIFCDIDPNTFNIDANKIEELITPDTTAILPIHVFGNPCDNCKIEDIANKYGLKIIYDAAHAFGVKKDNINIGNFKDISIFSFHPTKLFHTAEGGAITCKDVNLGKRLEYLNNFGIKDEETVIMPGINGKMNELSAIMGLCVLKEINKHIKQRKKLTELYIERLKEINGISFPIFKNNVKRNYQYMIIQLETNGIRNRNYIYDKLKNYNIFTRKYFYPLCSSFKWYKNLHYDVPIAEKVSNEVLCLPLYGDLNEDEVNQICDIIKKLLD